MKITDLPKITNIKGDEVIMLVKDGVSYQATLDDIRSGEPDANRLYPDVPINYVEIVRYSGQESTTVVLNGNTSLVDKIWSGVFPCTIGRDGLITQMLNGNDTTKTIDGLRSVLDDWQQPCMVRYGGYWTKYFYDDATNIKHFRFSPYKVRGYKYVRRRFLSMYNATVETHDEKPMLLSNAGLWSTQSKSLTAYHAAAKNLGSTFRVRCIQDRKVYRDMFWLLEKTFNSQSVQQGINGVNSSWWQNWSQAEDGGASSYGQFHRNGVTNEVVGHKGEVPLTFNNSGTDFTVKAQRWGWIEGYLSGPYWQFEGGAIKKADKWYVPNDINTYTAFNPDAEDYHYLCDAAVTNGFILEDYSDTVIPSLIGGSDKTGHADYYWRTQDDSGTRLFIPACSGDAYNGSSLGVSVVTSCGAPSLAAAHYGAALASDDPTDTIPDETLAK